MASMCSKMALYSLVSTPPPRENPLLPLTNNHSGINWLHPRQPTEHLPGETSLPTRQNVQHPRGPPRIRLRRVHPHASRAVLVRMDVVLVCSMDRAHPGPGLCDDGHLLHLPGYLQLPGGYVPSICQFSHCSAIVLYAHPHLLVLVYWQQLTNIGRNILAGVFPLVANFMFTNLTYPGAASLLGGIVRTLIQPSCPSRAY